MMGALGLASASQVFGASAFLAGAPPAAGSLLLAKSDLQLVEEVADTILPTTESSPGAKAAGIGAFMQDIVSHYYGPADQKQFLDGLAELREYAQKHAGSGFIELAPKQREALLLELENADETPPYYRMIKQLSVWGYFSSEVGTKQALRFLPIPGRYDGEVKIEPGTKAWANLLA